MSAVVLVVDDDPVQRRLIENMVQRFGYKALTADGGDAAVKLLCGPDGEQIDCVILDLVMPDLDGLGVMARMKDAGRNIPVIVQTAHGGIDNVVSAMRAGATDFVVKPAGAERHSGQPAQRTRDQGAGQRIAAAQAQPRRHALFRRRHHPLGGDERRVAQRGESRGFHHSGADRRRIRRRQGSDRPRHSRLAATGAGKAVRRRQLRRAARQPRRSRSCSGTRRAPSPAPPTSMRANSRKPTAAPCSSTRSASCRWTRRSSCCARCRKARSSRSGPSDRQGRCADRLRHQPQPAGRRESRPLPRGPVLPPERLSDRPCRRCVRRKEDIAELARHFIARFTAEEGKRVRRLSPTR